MANIKDVAKEAGVGIATVSRVINGNKNVSPELKARVERAIARLGYSANQIARGLKMSETKNIAVIITSISRIFFTDILEGISQIANEHGYEITISESKDSFARERKLVCSYAAQWVDGIILSSCACAQEEGYGEYVESLSRFQKKGRPIPVIALEYPSENPSVDAVIVDHRLAAYRATKHLLRQGKRKILHIAIPEKSYMGRCRREGYERALVESGIAPREEHILRGDYTSHAGYCLTMEALERGLHFDGIFAANDQMAVGAVKALLEKGVSIPQEVAVIGNDDVFVSSVITPSLSSVHIPRLQMGRSAMELLHATLTGTRQQKERQIIKLPTQIVARQSTVAGQQCSLKDLRW